MMSHVASLGLPNIGASVDIMAMLLAMPPLYASKVRMAERSKALRSGRSPLLWAWVRIPLLTTRFAASKSSPVGNPSSVWTSARISWVNSSRVAQWKRAGPITQRSVDRNYALLVTLFGWMFSQHTFLLCPIQEDGTSH